MAAKELADIADRFHVAEQQRFSALLGDIIHDINNPLDIFLGYAEILDENADQSLKKAGNAIAKTALRISAQMKSLQTIYCAPVTHKPQSISVKELLETVFLAHKSLLKRGTPVPSFENIAEGLAITCRPGQVARILIELITNALEAVGSVDESWVVVSAAVAGPFIEIRVTDSGTSLWGEAAVRAKIFEPFFTTKNLALHSGLGLSLALNAAQANSGSIVLEATATGTAFVVSLPKT